MEYQTTNSYWSPCTEGKTSPSPSHNFNCLAKMYSEITIPAGDPECRYSETQNSERHV
jgi:hypothetical protein